MTDAKDQKIISFEEFEQLYLVEWKKYVDSGKPIKIHRYDSKEFKHSILRLIYHGPASDGGYAVDVKIGSNNFYLCLNIGGRSNNSWSDGWSEVQLLFPEVDAKVAHIKHLPKFNPLAL